jgi:hypothetical protein
MSNTYIPYKLGRKNKSLNKDESMVYDGKIFETCRAYVYDYSTKEKIVEDTFVPVIDKCVWIQGRGLFDYVRTSKIIDFYIHEDYDNSKDKILLSLEDAHLLKDIKWSAGDILLTTLNSIYYLQKSI